ncbi:MAG: hypothetical protein WBA74_07400 [Cyclobacteriaceae bacterium]
MEADRIRRPGSVRLTEEQYEEMEALGIENESAYVKYKLAGAQKHLQVLHHNQRQWPVEPEQIDAGGQSVTGVTLQDKLALQKLSLENEQLRDKLDELDQNREESLGSIPHQVEGMLRDELLKRDFEAEKKENVRLSQQIDVLKKELKKTEANLAEKEVEIAELVKKLGFLEIGKVLLPGAINGLANRYPKEMHGLASTLGSLTGEDAQQLLSAANLSEEQQNLLNIMEYFRSLFDDPQFEQVIQLVGQLGELIKTDSTVLDKLGYYLQQLEAKRKDNEGKQVATND